MVRAFRSDTVPHVEESLIPARDLENVDAELILADSARWWRHRLERIAAGKRSRAKLWSSRGALHRCQATLDAGQPLREADLGGKEWQAGAFLGFLTLKLALVVVNIDEDQLHGGGYPGAAEISGYASARNIPVVTNCAQVETEIASLEVDAARGFLGAMGITEPGD